MIRSDTKRGTSPTLSHNIYELFATKFDQFREHPFLTVPGGPRVSYGEVDALAAAFATSLGEAGAEPGDRVVVQVEKSINAVALYLACLRGGFIYIPLNTAYTPEEVGFFLGDATPSIMVFPSSRADKLRPVAELAGVATTFTLDEDGTGSLVDAAEAVENIAGVVPREADDVACILYTSGTTGRSKGAMLTHQGIAVNGTALHSIWRFRQGDVLLHALPIFHVHGLFIALNVAMLNVSEVLFLPTFDVHNVRAQLPHATVMMGVPTFYTRLLNDPEFGGADCVTIRMFTSGSAPMTETVFNQFNERTGHTICERYGMTECGIITSNPPEGERIAGTVGFALPQMEMRVVDKDDEILPSGEVGQVQVRGPHLFAGYWQLSHITADALTADGFFRTGDLGFADDDGRLTLVGRTSDMIISGGYNVYPKEVELALDQVSGVVESAVVGLPHPDFGEGVTAFVVVDASFTDEMIEESISKTIEDQVARFKQPKHYVFVDELPRNAMGKVQKAQLRANFAELYTSE